jgi:hypothetical protein
LLNCGLLLQITRVLNGDRKGIPITEDGLDSCKGIGIVASGFQEAGADIGIELDREMTGLVMFLDSCNSSSLRPQFTQLRIIYG